MKIMFRLLLPLFVFIITSCSSSSIKEQKPLQETNGDKKGKFVFRETIASGTDTAMITVSGLGRVPVVDVLCQKWEPENSDDSDADGNSVVVLRVYPELIFFPDSQVVQNPRSDMQIGAWRVTTRDRKLFLTLTFPDEKDQYLIRSIGNYSLQMSEMLSNGKPLKIMLYSDGMSHENMLNDPFHPSNMKWRIKPKKSENDSLIYDRVRHCVKFFALYYRDNIKRNYDEISFEGLPKIFRWYSGGIGLPDKEDLEDSWIDCFYNKNQALKGYEILHKLIVNYEFNWDKSAPNWVYQTHSVLEQMFWKLTENQMKGQLVNKSKK